MTLIVGWKCRDGVVVGADSAATLGFMGEQTVQEFTTKLLIVKDALILGVSGPVGLAQRFHSRLNSIPTPEFDTLARKRVHEGSSYLSGMLWEYAGVEYQRAHVVAQAMGSRAPVVENALNRVVIAARVQGEERLFQFSETCAPEEATADLPYVSIGSGQRNADPFLAFIRDVFWKDDMPNLEGGIFATLWTLIETIRSSPGGVAEPTTIGTLQGGTARLLEDDELAEDRVAINEARKALRDFRPDLEPGE